MRNKIPKKTTTIGVAVGLLVSIGCFFAPHALASSARAARPTILLTHPQPSVLNYYVQLVKQGVLAIPDLHIEGIYHADEAEDYQAAAEYLSREEVAWMTLTQVDCDLPLEAVYAENACTDIFRSLVHGSAGMIVSGGPDLPPELYGRPLGPTTRPSAPARHRFEVSLLYHLLGRGEPQDEPLISTLRDNPAYAIMGVCGGMQCINVAAGGTLVQDIALEIYGDGPSESPPQAHYGVHGPQSGVYHPVCLLEAALPVLSHVFARADDEASVLSIHHQAVDDLGHSLAAIATSLDGLIVEAIAHRQYPHVVGWQFHPELPALWMGPDDAARKQAREFAAAIWRTFATQVQQSSHELNLGASCPAPQPGPVR